MTGMQSELNLQYFDSEKEKEVKLVLVTANECARQIYEDIVSYCILRCKESQRLLYGLEAMPEFEDKFQNSA